MNFNIPFKDLSKSEKIQLYVQHTQPALNKKALIPPFMSIDQEGGRVERTEKIHKGKKYLSAKNAYEMGISFLQDQTKQIALELKSYGFNMNFAPVLDVNTNFVSSVILTAGARLTFNKKISTGSLVVSTNDAVVTLNKDSVYTGSRLNAHGGGTFAIYGSMSISNDFSMGGTVNVFGTLKANQSNNANYTYFNVSASGNPIGGRLTVKNGGKVYFGDRSIAKNNGLCANLKGSITIEKGGYLDALNGIKMHSGSIMNFAGGTTNIDAVIMANYDKSGVMKTKSTMTMNVSGATTLTKVVMDDGSFENANDTQLTINFNGLANGEALTINELTGLTTGRFIVLENFSEGDFFVKNVLATNADGSIIGMTFGGESLFQLEDGKIVIPEPSTYAMIFGAIALGFVAYRRRK